VDPNRLTTECGIVDLNWFRSQHSASPLAFHGDVLFQSVGGEMCAWNAMTMQRTDRWVIPHRHFCIVQDGTVVVFGEPMRDASRQIHRITKGRVESLQAPVLPIRGTNVVLPASSPDRVYLTIQDDIYLLKLSSSSVKIEATLEHPAPNSATRDQWVSRGDGRIIGIDRERGLRVLAPGTSTSYVTDRRAEHLVAGTRDQIWYSYALPADEAWNIHTIVLAEITSPATAIRRLDVAPARAIHIASHGDMLAVLLFYATSPKDVERSVALFDETGRERWRSDVPPEFMPSHHITNAFIALGEHTVVVGGHGDQIVGWSVATGKKISG
jgi:hypothetical protein